MHAPSWTGRAHGTQGDDMAGISTTGSALPTAQSLFAGSTDPASTTSVQGPTVQGPGGTTTLPDAAPADFQGENPTPLDQPHPQYPTLIQSHVAVLQAIGTPEAIIQQLAASQPPADYMDRYIQGEIMQNPEGWDAYTGNPTGTTRAGLQALIPGIQLPAPGAGSPGYMPDGSRVDGINVPGITTPLIGGAPGTPRGSVSEGEGLIKGLVIAAAVVGAGLLAWKFMKGRGAGKETEQAAGLIMGGGAGGQGGGLGNLTALVDKLKGSGLRGDELLDVQRTLSLQTVAGGGIGGLGSAGGAATAATIESIFRGQGAANGFINSAGASAVAFNMSMPSAIEAALADRAMGVLEQLARNGGTVADLAAARVLTTQLSGVTAAGGQAATQLAGLRQSLAGLANLVV
jgi:hypothetical protein